MIIVDVNTRELIRKELERRGWSQRELCRRTKMYPAQLCDYLNGSRDLYVETLELALKALDLEIMPARRRRKGR